MQPVRVIAFAGAVVSLLGLATLIGFAAPNAPSSAMVHTLPAVTLSAVIIGGIADGFNPCAFTVLLLFITALLAASQARAVESAAFLRGRLIGLGSIYIASVFLTYLTVGVGFLSVASLFTQGHLPARLGAVLAIGLGLWMLKDYFLPEYGPRLKAPAAVGRWAQASAKRATVPALIGGGVLIGLCTLPCSGALYLAVLSLLAVQPSALTGFGYLVLYNVVFVLPLVVILLLASSRPVLNRLAHWNLKYRQWVSLGLGSGVILMGFVILGTV